MFGFKKLRKSCDEWKALAYKLEAELREAKTAHEEAERKATWWEEQAQYLEREAQHDREKLTLSLRALQAENRYDALLKRTVDAIAMTPPAPFVVKTK